MGKRVEAKRRKKKQNRGMNPLLVVVGGLILLIAALAVSVFNSGSSSVKAPIAVTGSPALKVDKDRVDLGDIPLGKTVEVSFTLTNVGDKTLELKEEPYVEIKEGC